MQRTMEFYWNTSTLALFAWITSLRIIVVHIFQSKWKQLFEAHRNEMPSASVLWIYSFNLKIDVNCKCLCDIEVFSPGDV